MTQMKAKFTFYKAGQGSFYAGQITNGDKGFIIVYDCGTSSFVTGSSKALNAEIEDFKKTAESVNAKRIDLLFISHLDYDHVSGVKYLLKNFDVKKVIMPYLEPESRVICLCSHTNDDDDFSFEDYVRFIEEPVSFIRAMSNYKDIEIYFINPEYEDTLQYYNNEDGEGGSDGVDNKGTTLEPLPKEFNTPDKLLHFYKNNLQFFIGKKWEFTTYVKALNKTAVDIFKTNLKKCLKLEDITFETLKQIFLEDKKEAKVKSKRKKAHECYKNNIGDINSHGLILLHRNVDHKTTYFRCYIETEPIFRVFPRDFGHFLDGGVCMHTCTLLLGDTSLAGPNKLDLPRAFTEKIQGICFIQVPHHGASKNWEITAFQKFKKDDNVIFAICNFGFGNRYGHPSYEVINGLKNLNICLSLNTQFSRITTSYF